MIRSNSFFNGNKGVRRLLVLWAASLITWVVVQVFTDITLINSAINSALAIVVGLLATAIAMYKWSRDREDREKRQEELK